MMVFGMFTVEVPLPVLLAVAATLGYLVGRWRRSGEICPQCKQQMKHPMTT
jgi:hypothetical protein